MNQGVDFAQKPTHAQSNVEKGSRTCLHTREDFCRSCCKIGHRDRRLLSLREPGIEKPGVMDASLTGYRCHWGKRKALMDTIMHEKWQLSVRVRKSKSRSGSPLLIGNQSD